jgi:hypothetical protein
MIRMEDDIAEAALAAIVDGGNALDGNGRASARSDQEQSPALLRDEVSARREEGHRPGLVELGHRLDRERPAGAPLRGGGGGDRIVRRYALAGRVAAEQGEE